MVRLALVDALAVESAVGFLGRHYRDALVEHAGVISLGVLVVAAGGSGAAGGAEPEEGFRASGRDSRGRAAEEAVASTALSAQPS